MRDPVILEAVRTPFGRFRGAHRETLPSALLSQALVGVMDRAQLDPAKLDDVVAGAVTQTTEQGFNIARIAALEAGIPAHVPAVSLNRACSSSQQAAHFIAQGITAGDITFGIAAGVEHMTRVPMFSDVDPKGEHKGSWGMLSPKLLARHPLVVQGESAERMAEKYELTRWDLDEFAMESHRRVARAASKNLNSELLGQMTGLDREGETVELVRDEGIRDTLKPEKVASLPTIFRPGGNGVVTAGNSSQLADGASAVLIGDKEAALGLGLTPRARFRARVAVGSDPVLQLDGVVPATRKALEIAGLSLRDIDWIEINEAFASVVLGWARTFGPDMEKVNPWGGAIAHGHPLGSTGGALMAKMLTGLETTSGQFGLQVMCAAHGMATATIIERI